MKQFEAPMGLLPLIKDLPSDQRMQYLRTLAAIEYYQTGDSSKAEKTGLFPKSPVQKMLDNVVKLQKQHEGTEWTKEHGLEFNEDSHRWMCPVDGCKGEEHTKNISNLRGEQWKELAGSWIKDWIKRDISNLQDYSNQASIDDLKWKTFQIATGIKEQYKVHRKTNKEEGAVFVSRALSKLDTKLRDVVWEEGDVADDALQEAKALSKNLENTYKKKHSRDLPDQLATSLDMINYLTTRLDERIVEHIESLPTPMFSNIVDKSDIQKLQQQAEHIDTRTQPAYQNPANNDAVQLYVHDGFQNINTELIFGGRLDQYERRDLAKFRKLMKPIGKSNVLWRGVPKHKDVRIGEPIDLKALTSSSRDPAVAMGFATPMDVQEGVLFEYHVGPQTKAIELANGDEYKDEYGDDWKVDEDEVILDMGQRGTVTHISEIILEGTDKNYKYVVVKLNEPTKGIQKSPEGTEWTREHGLQFDEDKHRWVCPAEGCKVEEPHSHLEDDSKEIAQTKLSDYVNYPEQLVEEMQTRQAYEKAANYTDKPAYASLVDDPFLRDYVGEEEIYVSINDYMMQGWVYGLDEEEENDLKQIIRNIEYLMTSVGEERVVYRGLPIMMQHTTGGGHEVSEGDELNLSRFTSTSRDPYSATFFTVPERDLAGDVPLEKTMLEIRLLPSTKVIDLDNEDTRKAMDFEESETIVGRDQKLRIDKIHRNVDMDGVNIVNYIVATMLE